MIDKKGRGYWRGDADNFVFTYCFIFSPKNNLSLVFYFPLARTKHEEKGELKKRIWHIRKTTKVYKAWVREHSCQQVEKRITGNWESNKHWS